MKLFICLCIVYLSSHHQCLGYIYSRSENQWTPWSRCSVTCGQGKQVRFRTPTNYETRPCARQFCPTYMDWPRLHFIGRLVVDSSSLNNIRCNYNNEHFTKASLSPYTPSNLVPMKTDEGFIYGTFRYNWNPMGSGHVYFVNTHVSSLCTAPNSCSAMKNVVRETQRAQIVISDPDRQTVCEIWGLTVRIPGILEGRYKPTSSQYNGYRYSKMQMGRFKSKLENITWFSSNYQKTFNNQTTLSMTMVIDEYNHTLKSGRLAGTIGLTSSDDPLEHTSTRIMRSKNAGGLNAPMYYHDKKQLISLDLSASLPAFKNKTLKVRNLYLAITINCRFPYIYPDIICNNVITSTSGHTFFILEALSSKYFDLQESWYKVLGGVVDVDVAHLPKCVTRLINNHRIAVLRMVEHSSIKTFKIVLHELLFGINIGVIDTAVKRLNVGQSTSYTPFVSKYGKPVSGADLKMVVAPANASVQCNFKHCNLNLSVPRDALLVKARQPFSNLSGLNEFYLTALKDPEYPRCGIDGQLYVMAVHLTYNVAGKRYVFTNSDLPLKDTNVSVRTVRPVTRIYNKVPVKKCPGWLDIQDIFIQYYNLYPVMWRNGIIDLHSYTDVRKKAKMLKTAMFETDFRHPQYMPVSRDLSLSKQELIWNWMECGMKFDTSPAKQETCSVNGIEDGKVRVQKLLEAAVQVELATIPPYFTAWLSLKTGQSRNLEIASLIKSIYTEEMLHMSLAGNLLNSVGGTVNLTDMSQLPAYPTSLGTGSFYNLALNVLLPLEKFSISLVRDVFTKVENPSPPEVQKIFLKMAALWKTLSKNGEPPPQGSKMKLLMDEYDAIGNDQDELLDTKVLKNVKGEAEKWKAVKSFSHNLLQPVSKLTKTIGSLYAKILTNIAYLESCLQLQRLDSGDKTRKTLFVGDVTHQLNMSHWYNPSKSSNVDVNVETITEEMNSEELIMTEAGTSFTVKKTKKPKYSKHLNLTNPLFPVVDLKSAIQAVIEIVYQGEGGSPCSVFRKSSIGTDLSYENSHYAKFLEIVHGRKVKAVDITTFSHLPDCLNHSDFGCHEKQGLDKQFCFVGEQVPFDEDGVWPIISNPGDLVYSKNSAAYTLNKQFNIQYTRLLWCLQDVFGGRPHRMKTCMSNMYDLVIAGKKLVATPIRPVWPLKDEFTQANVFHATPSWTFVRDAAYTSGLCIDWE